MFSLALGMSESPDPPTSAIARRRRQLANFCSSLRKGCGRLFRRCTRKRNAVAPDPSSATDERADSSPVESTSNVRVINVVSCASAPSRPSVVPGSPILLDVRLRARSNPSSCSSRSLGSLVCCSRRTVSMPEVVDMGSTRVGELEWGRGDADLV